MGGGTNAKKGSFLKHFRNFSHMFENKEPEMQIGLPTNVKHVAHIGWDGPNVNNPTWMQDYHSAPLNGPEDGADGRESHAAMTGKSQEFGAEREPPAESSDVTPTSTKKKHLRRRQSEGNIGDVSAAAAAADGTRRSRKPKKKNASSGVADPSGHDLPAIPKKSHRKRSKTPSRTNAAGSAATTTRDAEGEDFGEHHGGEMDGGWNSS